MERKRVYDGFYKIDVLKTPDGPRELVGATDSACILIYCPAKDAVLLVRQRRVSMISKDNPEGWSVEMVAGRFDVDLSVKDLLVKEAWEEARVVIHQEEIFLLNNGKPLMVNTGMTDEKSYLAYAEIELEDVHNYDGELGNPDEGERIQRVWVPLQDFLNNFVCDGVRLFAVQQWFARMLWKGGNGDGNHQISA